MLMRGRAMWDVWVGFPGAASLTRLASDSLHWPECLELRVTGQHAGTGWFEGVWTFRTERDAGEFVTLALARGGETYVGPFPRRPAVFSV